MEYLMTYGWAILIVAVVLAALFQLGVFSGATSPRALPGACKVIRPMGIGTLQYASLQGVCTGLLPEYVAQFTSTNGYISSPAISPSYVTDVLWAYDSAIFYSYEGYAGNTGYVSSASRYQGFEIMRISATSIDAQIQGTSGNGYKVITGSMPADKWVQYAFTYDGNYIVTYVDGVQTHNYSAPWGPIFYASNFDTYFGHNPHMLRYAVNGSISNVQIYNASLSANEVLALYKEGIGGAPIRIDTLVGWWPLNGNANDTSGNGNNGVPANVAYSSSWTSSYSLR